MHRLLVESSLLESDAPALPKDAARHLKDEGGNDEDHGGKHRAQCRGNQASARVQDHAPGVVRTRDFVGHVMNERGGHAVVDEVFAKPDDGVKDEKEGAVGDKEEGQGDHGERAREDHPFGGDLFDQKPEQETSAEHCRG